MTDHAASDAKQILALSERLQGAPRVLRLAQPGNPDAIRDVATEAAHGLVDIQRSCEVLFERLVPRLSSLSPDSQDFEDLLDDIAEEYRHIHYHIANTRLFNYVVDASANSTTSPAR
jgi:hypothetical protein